jgi:sugar (pentulose or hexulose) kinase
MDERALPHLETLVSRVASRNGADLIPEITAGSTVAILFWLAATRGIPKGAIPCSLPDFVMSRLSKSEAKCEPTMASGFGVFDVPNGGWHRDAIEELGLLGDVLWPKIVRTSEAIGTYPSGANRIPVYASLGDQQCALLGSLLKLGELSVNVSTGSQVSALRNRFEPGDYQVRSYFDGLFLNTVTYLPAGRALNEMVDLTKTPWSMSEESPLFRAAFENMAGNYHAAAMRLDPRAAWTTLVFSGGLIAKSTLLRQLVQKRFGLPVRASPAQEDTLLGLLLVSRALSGQSATVLQAMEAQSLS